MKKFSRILSASLMSAAMLTTSTVSFAAPMVSTFAAETGSATVKFVPDTQVFRELTPEERLEKNIYWTGFSDENLLQNVQAKDGAYEVEILNNNISSEGNIFSLAISYKRGFDLKANVPFEICWDVNASNDGYIYVQIGRGDRDVWRNGVAVDTPERVTPESWLPLEVKKGDNHFKYEYLPKKDSENNLWTISYGGPTYEGINNFPNGTILRFENMCINSGLDSINEYDVPYIKPDDSGNSVIGNGTFTNGYGYPWELSSKLPANQYGGVEDGKFVTQILSQSRDDNFSLGFKHKHLNFTKGHTYKIGWDINSTDDGEMYTTISDKEGDFGCGLDLQNDTWGYSLIKVKKGENHYEYTFTPQEDITDAEWAFYYGKDSMYSDGMPEYSTIKFDNMSLTCEECGGNADAPCNWKEYAGYTGQVIPASQVRINQLGYYKNAEKKATYVSKHTSPLTFHVLNAETNEEVYEGKTAFAYDDLDKTDYISCYHIINFSELTSEGKYRIVVDDLYQKYNGTPNADPNISGIFTISDSVYDGVLEDSLNYFYQNRAGSDIEAKYITSDNAETLAHTADYKKDIGYVQRSVDPAVPTGVSEYSVDVSGGWYDSGTYTKSVDKGAEAVWLLQNMYENNKNSDLFADGKGSIPESGNKAPDLLDEARYELEWMFKMIVDEKDPYYGDEAGLVYHSVNNNFYMPLGMKPSEYQIAGGARIVEPPTVSAAFDVAACAAQASRLWKGIDDDFADLCLEKAKLCYEAAIKGGNSTAFSDISAEYYEDADTSDELYWAACELFAATGEQTYRNEIMKSKYAFKVPASVTNQEIDACLPSTGENVNIAVSREESVPFSYTGTAAFGTLSLILSDKISENDKKMTTDNILAAADTAIDYQDEQAMGMPLTNGTYYDKNKGIKTTDYYGEELNFNVMANAIVMANAYNITGESKYYSGAAEAMDYIFGRNNLGLSFVTGYGQRSATQLHHQKWAGGIVPDGVVTAGHVSVIRDNYMKNVGLETGDKYNVLANYLDNSEAMSAATGAELNAALSWMVSFLQSNAENVTASDENVAGDANCDGIVDVADIVLVKSWLLNSEKYSISEQGVKNADVESVGNGINSNDAVAIQQYVLKMIDSLPVEK